ncbi:hypothetical protein OWM54_20630 [Myxococcus sp. MISCRS1]|jgi:hypothetical protein|uniref:hypothetical protein n=1 Tax=Myxococcus TaxID=32 RepID=UPI001143049F|nr:MULTISPECIES: hypothetical protein [Myxococcus]BDT38701.1 hypothetical protein MFMH1_83700 [Myxococcus sp. MH1]MBZ4399050.1 hypothetical protein [Myxococcus sp. AS-1-15]MBZ4413353.1 hypothetical protein [Myxococcus sp. XM-1-1-1]MCK8499708.1 hypothetical protein [Myxococcus fulvus]MCY0999544.1 hypothetical protein [Myxococcus sp. MISCRS1]
MSQDNAPAKPKRGLKRPIEVVRAELLNDADTKKIAKAVGMKLEDYVELVLKYAQDKDLEPELNIVPDEELKKNGITPVTSDEAADLLIRGMKGELPGSAPDFDNSKFEKSTPGTAGKPSLNADAPPSTTTQAPSTGGNQDAAARQAMLDQIKRGGGGRA